jgi:site-specific DNA recombinase
LLEDIQAERFDYVIVYKLDRLARNVVDDVQLTEEIEATGARLVSVTENFDDSPQGWLIYQSAGRSGESGSGNNEAPRRSWQ